LSRILATDTPAQVAAKEATLAAELTPLQNGCVAAGTAGIALAAGALPNFTNAQLLAFQELWNWLRINKYTMWDPAGRWNRLAGRVGAGLAGLSQAVRVFTP
jgi:hypothetical protein